MRDLFHRNLDQLVDKLVLMGDISRDMLADSLRALTTHDPELAKRVRRRDDDVNALYREVEAGILRVMALQAPVASDLRLVSAMLHVNIHAERMGDYAASVAKFGRLSADMVDDPELASQLQEMGRLAADVSRDAFRSFAQLDVELARTVEESDDQVDQLNLGIFHRLVRLAANDELRLEWATRMILVARQIERWSDHAVDISHQTQLVVIGATEREAG